MYECSGRHPSTPSLLPDFVEPVKTFLANFQLQAVAMDELI
jgi:hypothetical protein